MAVSLFRTRRAIESLTVGAIGASLAAVTGAIFAALWSTSGDRSIVAASVLSTLVLGTAWAQLLRWRKTLGRTGLRMGWLLSIPLAAANAGLAAGLFFASQPGGSRVTSFLLGCAAGVTVGAIVWVPGLVVTLLLFGLPIAWGQRVAREGLAGQERGDGVVGGVCALLSVGSLAAALGRGVPVVAAVAAVGAALGLAVATSAWWRAMQRRDFVAAVEDGRAPGFRIDATPRGKVLVRIVAQGEGYRVADFAEEVASLDAPGDSIARR